MLRNILYHLVPFLLPFIAYGMYLYATRKAREKGQAFDEAPWFWLFAAGLMLLVVSLIAVWLFTGNPADGVYTAPHVENGKIMPGKFN